ncbi:MAG: chemotaxis protein CheB [Ginsengibacter sp.]
MKSTLQRLFLIGASAGGHDAIRKTLQNIPPSIPASFLVVIHSDFNVANNFALAALSVQHQALSIKNVEKELSFKIKRPLNFPKCSHCTTGS